MTQWTTGYASIQNKPSELDTESSSTTVYERKNFEEVEQQVGDKKIKMWKYEERTYTKSEYELVKMITESMSIKHEAEIIDEYTTELLEEGVI